VLAALLAIAVPVLVAVVAVATWTVVGRALPVDRTGAAPNHDRRTV
jgi:hypothetical protein